MKKLLSNTFGKDIQRAVLNKIGTELLEKLMLIECFGTTRCSGKFFFKSFFLGIVLETQKKRQKNETQFLLLHKTQIC